MAAKKELSQGELSQRVAIIKRFKELLKAQRDRFAAYLEALDKAKDAIEGGTAEELLRHVELEEKIVADIYSIQKVIDPLEELYRSANSPLQAGAPEAHEADLPDIKSALEGLKFEAIARSERNRELLSRRMSELRAEIKSLRTNPYLQKRGSHSAPASGRVDIRG